MNRNELKQFLAQRTSLEQRVLDVIIAGAKNLNTVVIYYADNAGVVSEREVEPYEFKDGKLWAFCLVRNSIRQFSTGQIVNAVVTDRKFRPRWPVKIL